MDAMSGRAVPRIRHAPGVFAKPLGVTYPRGGGSVTNLAVLFLKSPRADRLQEASDRGLIVPVLPARCHLEP